MRFYNGGPNFTSDEERQAFDEDPVGYLANRQKSLEDQLAARDAVASVQDMVQEYRGRDPDYDRKLQHLLDARKRELRSFGYQEEQLDQILGAEAHQLAGEALRHGKNPAEVVSELAVARGFREPGPQPGGDDPEAMTWDDVQEMRAREDELNAPGSSIFDEIGDDE